MWDIITYPYLNFSDGLTKPALNFGLGWVITSHSFRWISFLIHTQSPLLIQLMPFSKKDPRTWYYNLGSATVLLADSNFLIKRKLWLDSSGGAGQSEAMLGTTCHRVTVALPPKLHTITLLCHQISLVRSIACPPPTPHPHPHPPTPPPHPTPPPPLLPHSLWSLHCRGLEMDK